MRVIAEEGSVMSVNVENRCLLVGTLFFLTAFFSGFSASERDTAYPIHKNITLVLGFVCMLLFSSAFAEVRIPQDIFKQQWQTGWEVTSKAPSALKWKRIGTEGDGKPVQVYATMKPTNLTAKIIEVNFRINSLDFLSGIELRFSADQDFKSYMSFSVPFFHDLDFNPLQPNTWHRLTFGLGHAEFHDMQGSDPVNFVAIYLADNTIAPMILDFTDLQIKNAQREALLSYTFDDGFQNQMLAAKIMAQFGHKGTAYIITDAIGSTGHLTLQQLTHLHRQGWGLSFHHTTPFTQLSSTELIEAINEGFDFFKENRMSTAMRHLAYPLGKQNRTYVLPLVRQYFNSARLADAGMETLPPGDWSLLRTVNIMPSTSVDEIRKLVIAAKTNHQWLILMFHNIKENPQQNFEISPSKFREIVKMIAKENIRVLPVHQVWKEFSN